MRCYYVLVHGKLEWKVALANDDASQPRGFYSHRYVLAANEGKAAQIACKRVRLHLKSNQGWLSGDKTSLELEAIEVSAASFLKLLKPDNRGCTFYRQE
ncbi:MAG: hypothetical protein H3C60_06925 [Sphingomonadaceae bacterium]|nr:hypothetical protein [Sphingomonadaceae bacterium]